MNNDHMIDTQIAARGIRDERVLAAMRSVPRELFVPPRHRDQAFEDSPLPLDRGQTISQPFIVGLMTARLQLRGDERVLEIGTGSGYQTAILARLAKEVFSAELEPELLATVNERLESLGIDNVVLRAGNGLEVFRDAAPFDAILVAASPATMPDALFDQLAEGGRAILPVGGPESQSLWLVRRVEGRVVKQELEAVRFVPLRGGGW
jgi:protein-L-isoaspartate(D-aspartate) O-methyltransferase